MKFSIIYADPPWNFETWSKKGMDRSPDYPVLDLHDITYLNVPSISEDNSVLFLWATSPLLPQAINVVQSWGFEYKTVAFTWIKKNKVADTLFMGLGYYTRANAEYCLLGTRGKPLTRINKDVSSVVMTHYTSHSEKPDEVRQSIHRLFGPLSSIELFARSKHSLWRCIGNEITGNDIRKDITLLREE
jgi:N6-adenosine-specific RNA methylase IME4